MSHSFMQKTKLKDLPLVCYRCGAQGKKVKCKQYGNMVWCSKCKTEIDRMDIPKPKDEVHRPFQDSRVCACKDGDFTNCPIHRERTHAAQ